MCKKWSEVALDELWRDSGDVYSLLKLAIDDDSFYDGRSKMDDVGVGNFFLDHSPH